MRVLIVGCGYVGMAFARRALASGYEVVALRRDTAPLSALGAVVPLRADITDPATLRGLPSVDAAIFCQAPSKDSTYRAVYDEGTRNVLEALKPGPATKLIFLSSTRVYAEDRGEWIDERAPVGGDAQADCLLAGERRVLDSRGWAMVLRLAGIYGPGRNRIAALRAGTLKPEMSGAHVNRIHVDDIVSALFVLLMNGQPGEIYNGCDDRPCTQREFYEWLGGQFLKLEIPASSVQVSRTDPASGGKRCANAKLKSLGWAPAFLSYIEGYGELLRQANN